LPTSLLDENKFDLRWRRQGQRSISFFLIATQFFIHLKSFLFTSSTRYNPRSSKVKWSNASLQYYCLVL